MITTQKFNGILKSIRSTGDKLDALIADGIEYCVQQAQKAGNFDAFAKLVEACPVYARRIVHDAEKASRKAHKERNWREDATELARAKAVDELAERRNKVRNARKAKAEPASDAPADTVRQPDGPAVQAKGGKLVSAGGDTITLSDEEYKAAVAAVAALRGGELKPKLVANG